MGPGACRGGSDGRPPGQCGTHAFWCGSYPFELFGSFGTVFSGPLGRFLQPLLPVGVQTVSIIPWALLELHQLLRGTGGIGLHISRYPPADRSQGRLGHTGVLFPQTAAGSSCRRRASSTAAGRRDCGPAPGPGGPAQVRPELGTLSAASSWPEVPEGLGAPQQAFCGAKTASVYTLALLDTNVHPTNLRKCKNRIIFLSLMYSRILLQ